MFMEIPLLVKATALKFFTPAPLMFSVSAAASGLGAVVPGMKSPVVQLKVTARAGRAGKASKARAAAMGVMRKRCMAGSP